MNIIYTKNNVEVFLLGNTMNLIYLNDKSSKICIVKRFRDVISISKPKGQMYIFDYGVAISWGIIDSKKTQLLDMVQEQVAEKNFLKETEELHFQIIENRSVSIIDDTIILPDNKTMTLLAVSHALAQ